MSLETKWCKSLCQSHRKIGKEQIDTLRRMRYNALYQCIDFNHVLVELVP